MSFARPEYVWLLSAVPMLAVVVAVGRIRRVQEWCGLAQGGRLYADGGLSWTAAIVLLIVALAQPRWGRVAAPPLPPGHDVVLVIDASRSMGAEDAVPNRLGVAVESAESLLRALARQPGNRAAVVAFAGRGVLRCPLTEHLRAAGDVLRELKPGSVRPGGTDLASALDAALDAFDDQEHAEGRAIVLFTDGEDLAGTWSREVDRLRSAGVVLHAVAVGDSERGHPVPSGRGQVALRYRGEPVLSRRTDRPLEELTRAAGGAVVPLGLAPADLGALYVHRIAPIARRTQEAARVPERVERYGLFVLGSLSLGLAGGWSNRGRWWYWGRAWLVAACVLGGTAAARPPRSAAGAIAAGRSAFAEGRYAEALADFEAAIAHDPGAAVPRYNAAATLYRLDRFEEALARYAEARERAGPVLVTKIDYALGNTALALGDVATAIRHYDDCLASRAPGELLDRVRADAAINRKFAEEQERKPAPPPPEDETASRPPDRPKDTPPPGESGDDRGDLSKQAKTPPGGFPPPGGGTPAQSGGDEAAQSAEERLNAALGHVREAKRRRLPEEPPDVADEDLKDW